MLAREGQERVAGLHGDFRPVSLSPTREGPQHQPHGPLHCPPPPTSHSRSSDVTPSRGHLCGHGLAALRSHHCPSGACFSDVDSHTVTRQQARNVTLEVPGHLPSPIPCPVLGTSGECVTLSHMGWWSWQRNHLQVSPALEIAEDTAKAWTSEFCEIGVASYISFTIFLL